MNLKAHYAENLCKLLFLNIKKERLKELFNVDLKEDIYMPVGTENLAKEIKETKALDVIPMSFFIEGMFYVLGADCNFKFNKYYEKMLLNTKDGEKYIKSKIAKEIKKNNYEEGYIMLKGLCTIEKSKENFSKLLLLCDKLRDISKLYVDEELNLISQCKELYNDFPEPYLYEALILKEQEDFQKAYYCINTYLAKGGEKSKEISTFKESLNIINQYEKGKCLVNEEPKEALKLLIPLMQTLGDKAEIYYYVAVGYRNMKNHDKAIYYLNEALAIDDKAVEIINEMGLNYASIGEYKKAIAYFRDAFSFTGSIEICTNLIMCYLNMNDLEQAKVHLKLAKEIDPEDEIVKEIEENINFNI